MVLPSGCTMCAGSWRLFGASPQCAGRGETKKESHRTMKLFSRKIRQVVRNTYGLMDKIKMDVTNCDTLLKENTI